MRRILVYVKNNNLRIFSYATNLFFLHSHNKYKKEFTNIVKVLITIFFLKYSNYRNFLK